jgi:abequosyltransferase
MPSIRLSICIPTFNFGPFIGQTLESIVQQATDDVEIVVVDGGSADNTSTIVAGFKERFPRLNYVRLPERGGIDNDMALSAEKACGEFCWFFGADDIMDDGAVRKVLERTSLGDDVILVETTLCSFAMEPVSRYRNLFLDEERSFELSNPEERRAYFSLAANTQAFFSFCGGFVFRRSRWMASDWDRSFIGSCWAHAARVLALIPDGLRVRHVPGPITRKRQGNDSFATGGVANRLRIGIEGYLRIAETMFGAGTFEARHIQRALRRDFSLFLMLTAKMTVLRSENEADRALIDSLFARLYAGVPLIAAAYRSAPRFVWDGMSLLHRLTRRLTGW